MSECEVHFSTWRAVDDIHLDKNLSINFPVSHDEQRRVVNGFKAISATAFDNCAGYADGLLAWTLRPHEKHDVVSEVGVKKITAGERANLV